MCLAAQKAAKSRADPGRVSQIDLNDRIFRHGLDIVLVATIVNLLVVSVASYRGAAYMDSPQFCGQSCHVMHPEYTAYKISAHSHVACVECHIGTGAQRTLQRQGQRHQAADRGQPASACAAWRPSSFPTIPRRFRRRSRACARRATPARAATRRHTFDGDKLLVKSSFADDEQNTETQTVRDASPGRASIRSRI